MDAHAALAATPFAAVALLLLAVGYRVRVRGDVHLLAGYDPARVRDPAGLARWAGGVLLALGAVAAGAALAQVVRPMVGPVIARTFGAIVVASAVALVLGSRRYAQ